MVTYSSHDESSKSNSITSSNINFKDNVLNTTDIMCKIFQYLQYRFWTRRLEGDLLSCGLVNTHFLYHAWNGNSIYHVNLCTMIDDVRWLAKSSYKVNKERMSRVWQRFVKAKSVNFKASGYLGNTDDVQKKLNAHSFLVSKMAMLNSIEKLGCEVRMNCFEQSIFEEILNSEEWCEKIQEFKCEARMNPFELPSVSSRSNR